MHTNTCSHKTGYLNYRWDRWSVPPHCLYIIQHVSLS